MKCCVQQKQRALSRASVGDGIGDSCAAQTPTFVTCPHHAGTAAMLAMAATSLVIIRVGCGVGHTVSKLKQSTEYSTPPSSTPFADCQACCNHCLPTQQAAGSAHG